MASQHSSILIIGAGIFGTSTAYHLAQTRPDLSVTVIDRTSFPPDHAASTDINKIIRQDYTSRFYMDLATEAMDAWATWPELAGKGFFHRTGWINFSAKGSDTASRIRRNFRDRGKDGDWVGGGGGPPPPPNRPPPWLSLPGDRSQREAPTKLEAETLQYTQKRDPTSDVPIPEARTKFGGIFKHTDFDDFESAYWNPDAGWCDAGLATAELMKVAVNKGVRYVTGDVSKLIHGDGGVAAVETRQGERYSADKVLLASGAWTSSLMTSLEDSLDIPTSDRVEQQIIAAGVCVAHYKMGEKELEMLKEMPVTIYGDEGDAQPPPPRNNLLKFTNGHSFTNTVTRGTTRISMPLDRDQREAPEKLKAETLRYTHRLMPQLTAGRPVEYWRLCWDAVSPSQDHIISQHPNSRLSNLYLAVGGSFHSYKFLPTIGKYVINILEGRSNGKEKDEHWAWKRADFEGRGAHEKAFPQRELRDLEDGKGDVNKARL